MKIKYLQLTILVLLKVSDVDKNVDNEHEEDLNILILFTILFYYLIIRTGIPLRNVSKVQILIRNFIFNFFLIHTCR